MSLKKIKLDLLADTELLLMVEKCIRGGICLAIHMSCHVQDNNKYMKDYDEST